MWDCIGKIAVAIFAAKISYSLLKGIYANLIASSIGLGINFKKLGKWAVVTGATDGIGKAFAEELAKKKFDVVLISRTPSKLNDAAANISEKYNVQTKTIAVDFTHLYIYERIKKELEGLDIGILINNVGMSYSYPEYYLDLDQKTTEDLLICNVHSITNMCRIVGDGMRERKRGCIINISSLTSLLSSPFLAGYGASKAFVTSFSKSLSLELQESGVTVQCLNPGFVVSKMSKLRKSSFLAPTPNQYVRGALATTGVERITAGYYSHKLQIYLMSLVDLYLPDFILSNFMYMTIFDLRKRALKRLTKEK